jgi:predicted MFS family arabinose efflux permease
MNRTSGTLNGLNLPLLVAIYINIVGPSVFIVQPSFVQMLVAHLGFGTRAAGYIASAEMWGIALATLALTVLMRRCQWRRMLRVASVFIVIGNLASVLMPCWEALALCRFVAGLGCGALISIGFTVLGISARPDRNFGLMIAALLSYGALGMWLLPVAASAVGSEGVFLFFALLGGSVLPLVDYLPNRAEPEEVSAVSTSVLSSRHMRSAAVLAMFLYFFGQGVVWTYLFLIGTSKGFSEQQVASALSLSQFLAIAAALGAATVGTRYGRLGPVCLGILGGIVPLLFLFQLQNLSAFVVAVCVYNFAWNLLHPYLLGVMASLDLSGKVVTNATSAQMVGLAMGPAVAVQLIQDQDLGNAIWLGVVSLAAALCFIAPPILDLRRRQGSDFMMSAI